MAAHMQRVLVVEDSSVVQSIVQLALRRYGVVVTIARNGVEALAAIARDGEPDLMLVDINMPRMNGLELLAELRGSGAVPRIPVIMVSTEGAADMKRGLDAGARAYLRKPFRPDDLCTVIDGVMRT
ncbi:MAG: response regulator [Deltaproteobacteria bacterium]|nr:response regulator [Deltaproteobacteria bacterium]